ncbi:hypothetical protein CPC08DRAFT_770741 [Agrocybe pediades]|nr:hypothetical protein CPC08DRAFT_770741 [Agrocybe pediades]
MGPLSSVFRGVRTWINHISSESDPPPPSPQSTSSSYPAHLGPIPPPWPSNAYQNMAPHPYSVQYGWPGPHPGFSFPAPPISPSLSLTGAHPSGFTAQYSSPLPAGYPWPQGYPPPLVNNDVPKEEPISESPAKVKIDDKRKKKSRSDEDSSDSDSSTDSSYDWPQGDQFREVRVGTESRDWNQTKWQFRSRGTTTHHSVLGVEVRVCLGLICCGGCGRPSRPKTDLGARKLQLSAPCGLCGKGELYQETCNARTYNWRVNREDGVYKIWEHTGHHEHGRVPDGPVTASEKKQVDKQVGRNINASAHQLRTGDGAPGSVPLAKISQKLANPRAARHQIAQSKVRLGISGTTASSGGISFLNSIASFQEELNSWFIIRSSMYDPCFIMLQLTFMKDMLIGSVTAWNNERGEGIHRARHGMITDGDHTFFRKGVLLTTTVFSSAMAAWVPILYTLIFKQDIAHHRPHFKEISQAIVEFIQKQGFAFETKYLLHVFDFSNAQRAAHAEEYADAIISNTPSFTSLSPESQKIEREKNLDLCLPAAKPLPFTKYLKEAEKAELGCNFHFSESTERLKKNGSLIPPEKIGNFDHYIRILLYSKTTREDFDSAVQSIQKEFPRIKSWLSWWLRPTIASMIFPVCSVVDKDVTFKVPKTSNPVEHSHSLLHHATGTDYDIIPGIQKLKLRVDELEAQYKAIQDGHFDPPQPRDPKRKTKKVFNANDGHPPDTLATLHPKGIQDDKTVNTNLFQSYLWDSPNSCFFNNGMELWFRAYA